MFSIFVTFPYPGFLNSKKQNNNFDSLFIIEISNMATLLTFNVLLNIKNYGDVQVQFQVNISFIKGFIKCVGSECDPSSSV